MYDHITLCLKELYWLPVSKELYLRDTVVVFKCIKGAANTTFPSRRSISGRITRQSKYIPEYRTVIGKKSHLFVENRHGIPFVLHSNKLVPAEVPNTTGHWLEGTVIRKILRFKLT
ncbi:Hypothetical predicted protein [Paramuricea clavata]|uniref:Uncharacterized protein n=1 Tax=Paramuricea clavata TaxID=317549 RepID=A0A7D9IFC4_PARCT|nr:Hypothetical predicted protein [Paramuricea clavata]